jgi:nucleotidyltransferase substrate binding protein (TIGR01987 family)
MSGVKKDELRWVQRFQNYKAAYDQFSKAVIVAQSRELNDLEKQGLIQAFEFTHELAWNVLKDFLEYQGHSGVTGSRDATREAFRRGLLKDGAIWMEMIRSRNQTSHTYNHNIAKEILSKIAQDYAKEFSEFLKSMEEQVLKI